MGKNRPTRTFIDNTGIRKEELGRSTDERNGWKEIVRSVHLSQIDFKILTFTMHRFIEKPFKSITESYRYLIC